MALRISLENEMNQQPIAIRRANKTTADFLHWLREKKAFEKQAADPPAHLDPFDRQAIMVWVDDGGRTSATTEEAKAPHGE